MNPFGTKFDLTIRMAPQWSKMLANSNGVTASGCTGSLRETIYSSLTEMYGHVVFCIFPLPAGVK